MVSLSLDICFQTYDPCFPFIYGLGQRGVDDCGLYEQGQCHSFKFFHVSCLFSMLLPQMMPLILVLNCWISEGPGEKMNPPFLPKNTPKCWTWSTVCCRLISSSSQTFYYLIFLGLETYFLHYSNPLASWVLLGSTNEKHSGRIRR